MTLKATRANVKKDYICRSCGFIGRAEVKTQGKRWIEIFLWAVFFFPGPFYTLWRWATRTLICPKCKSGLGLIDLDSKLGNELFEAQMRQPSVPRPGTRAIR